jgi:chlorite dismutase
MSKDPSWYLLPEAERKSIIAAHVKIAIESSNNYGVISYTTESFGIGDWEFVVIYELRNIAKWVAVTEELRHAEARKWIRNETPILTGIKRIDGLIS